MKRVETPVEGLPPIKRHIATHDSDGKSVYVASAPAAQYIKVPGTGGAARLWSVDSVPAKLEGDADMKAYLADKGPTSWASSGIVIPNGANLLVMDLEPGGTSPMHRTVSIDFSICVHGEILHELDGGETVLLKPGDHIVQRGTNHKWRNASSTNPARFIAVTLACEPFDIAGKLLKQEFSAEGPPAERRKGKL
ncbi:hypothetical protein LTR84_005101 [Exophiala bonariae]|uniref:Cupin type-2 domain-containing protein n=1 Tax=Exophiala bonariae TaxID=1690606 RepID=A0AAV9NP77_9EURO|nr:hypothetical protein LTR84_005101 [Exophiala bonariae]